MGQAGLCASAGHDSLSHWWRQPQAVTGVMVLPWQPYCPTPALPLPTAVVMETAVTADVEQRMGNCSNSEFPSPTLPLQRGVLSPLKSGACYKTICPVRGLGSVTTSVHLCCSRLGFLHQDTSAGREFRTGDLQLPPGIMQKDPQSHPEVNVIKMSPWIRISGKFPLLETARLPHLCCVPSEKDQPLQFWTDNEIIRSYSDQIKHLQGTEGRGSPEIKRIRRKLPREHFIPIKIFMQLLLSYRLLSNGTHGAPL